MPSILMYRHCPRVRWKSTLTNPRNFSAFFIALVDLEAR